jgi:hypothetical protein
MCFENDAVVFTTKWQEVAERFVEEKPDDRTVFEIEAKAEIFMSCKKWIREDFKDSDSQ